MQIQSIDAGAWNDIFEVIVLRQKDDVFVPYSVRHDQEQRRFGARCLRKARGLSWPYQAGLPLNIFGWMVWWGCRA